MLWIESTTTGVTPLVRTSCAAVLVLVVSARMFAVGKYLRTERADLPPSVATTISGAASFSAVSTAPLHTASVMRTWAV